MSSLENKRCIDCIPLPKATWLELGDCQSVSGLFPTLFRNLVISTKAGQRCSHLHPLPELQSPVPKEPNKPMRKNGTWLRIF
jgi:hypothetical protein